MNGRESIGVGVIKKAAAAGEDETFSRGRILVRLLPF
jgi:hypothetical protein